MGSNALEVSYQYPLELLNGPAAQQQDSFVFADDRRSCVATEATGGSRMLLASCTSVQLSSGGITSDFATVWKETGHDNSAFFTPIGDPLRCINNAARSVSCPNPETASNDSTLRWKAAFSQPVDLFTEPGRLKLTISDPAILLQLFLFSDAGKKGLSLLNKIQNVQRVALPLQGKLELVSQTIEMSVVKVNLVQSPLEEARDTLGGIVTIMNPIITILKIAVNKIVAKILRATKLDKMLASTKKRMDDASDLAQRVVSRMSSLLLPLAKADGLFANTADLLNPFAIPIDLKRLANLQVRALCCATEAGRPKLSSKIESSIDLLGEAMDSLHVIMLEIGGDDMMLNKS